MKDNFQNLILSDSEPRVLVENGEPRFVVVPWHEFEAMRCGGIARQYVRFAEVADEALDVPACVSHAGRPVFAPVRRKFSELAVDTAKIRLEDLPV